MQEGRVRKKRKTWKSSNSAALSVETLGADHPLGRWITPDQTLRLPELRPLYHEEVKAFKQGFYGIFPTPIVLLILDYFNLYFKTLARYEHYILTPGVQAFLLHSLLMWDFSLNPHSVITERKFNFLLERITLRRFLAFVYKHFVDTKEFLYLKIESNDLPRGPMMIQTTKCASIFNALPTSTWNTWIFEYKVFTSSPKGNALSLDFRKNKRQYKLLFEVENDKKILKLMMLEVCVIKREKFWEILKWLSSYHAVREDIEKEMEETMFQNISQLSHTLGNYIARLQKKVLELKQKTDVSDDMKTFTSIFEEIRSINQDMNNAIYDKQTETYATERYLEVKNMKQKPIEYYYVINK